MGGLMLLVLALVGGSLLLGWSRQDPLWHAPAYSLVISACVIFIRVTDGLWRDPALVLFDCLWAALMALVLASCARVVRNITDRVLHKA